MADKNEMQYVNIMVDSLKQKNSILDQIIQETQNQMDILKQGAIDFDAYDVKVDKKTELIYNLERLDDGFDGLYNKVQETLSSEDGKKQYRNEILSMQQLIAAITEKSTTIQALEARNKQMLETGFANARKQLGSSRNTSRAAMDYYRNMRQTNALPPQFLDSKK